MNNTNVKANATVRLVIELTKGSWGSECQLNQVYRQAKDEAVATISSVLEARKVRIKVLEVTVSAIIVPEKE